MGLIGGHWTGRHPGRSDESQPRTRPRASHDDGPRLPVAIAGARPVHAKVGDDFGAWSDQVAPMMKLAGRTLLEDNQGVSSLEVQWQFPRFHHVDSIKPHGCETLLLDVLKAHPVRRVRPQHHRYQRQLRHA